MFFKETLQFVLNLKIPVCRYICEIIDKIFYIFVAASLYLIKQCDHSAWLGPLNFCCRSFIGGTL
jgi:hypothetical protein